MDGFFPLPSGFSPADIFSAFTSISHQVPRPAQPDSFPDSTYHDIGWLDVFLIISLIALMAILRDATRLLILEPFAHWKLTRDCEARHAKHSNGSASLADLKIIPANGKSNGTSHNGTIAEKPGASRLPGSPSERRRIRRSVIRFAEQGWMFIYYLAEFLFGIYIYRGLPKDLWTGYPHIPLAAPVKLYYLLQTSFYLHLVLLINAEARRKDHWQMLAHHIITITLIILSYTYNFTRVGCFIMLIMDFCDIIFPFAKMLRYLGYQTACDIAFGTFMLSWLYTRHYLFIRVIISVHFDAPKAITFGWQPRQNYYLSEEALNGFVVLLSVLEVLQIIWCYMIFSVAWRVVSGQGADDSRSDDEGEDTKKER